MAGLTERQVKDAYSRVFSTADGMIVLSDILSELRYFSNQPGMIKPECIAVANTILSRCGVFSASGNGVFMEGLGYSINLAQAVRKDMSINEEEDDV